MMHPIIVLSGGLGSRLGSLTIDLPKALVKVNGRPFIDWQLNLLKEAGYKDVLLCLGHKSQQIMDYVGNGKKFSLKVNYSHDGETPLGTGGAVIKGIRKIGWDCAVIYGDSFLPIDFGLVEHAFQNTSMSALMTVIRKELVLEEGNLNYDNGVVTSYSKSSNSLNYGHVDFGLSYFKFDAIHNFQLGTPWDLSKLFQSLTKTGKLQGYEVETPYFEVGSTKGITRLESYLQRKENKTPTNL